MAELAGYIGQQQPPIDFNKISTDLTDRLVALDRERKAEQEKIDDFTAEAYSKVGDVEATTSQPWNNFVFDVATNGRSMINIWADQVKKGLMTRAQYKKLALTLSTDVGVLNKVGKTFNSNAAEMSKKMLAGEVSGSGIFKAQLFGEGGNLTDAKSFVSPEAGSLLVGKTNPKTGEVIKSSLASVATYGNYAKVLDPRIDLSKQAKGLGEILKGVGVYQELPGTNGVYGVVESAKNAANYKQIIESQVSSVLSSPEAYASVLADYGGYGLYYTEEQKKKLTASGKKDGDKDGDLLKYNYFNGEYVPELTETMKGKAQEIVRQNLEASLGTKISNVKTPPAPEKESETDKTLSASLGLSRDVWRDIKNATSKNLTDSSNNVIRQALGNAGYPNVEIGKYVNKNGVIGVNIYREGDETPTFNIKSKSDLHKILLLKTGEAASGELSYRKSIQLAKDKKVYVPYSAMLKKFKDSGTTNMTANDYKKQLEDAGYFIDEDQ